MDQIDYVDLWARWILFLEQGAESRKDNYDQLHLNTQKSMELIIEMGLDSVSDKLDALKVKYPNLQNELERSAAFAVWAGYYLPYLLAEKDPVSDLQLKDKIEIDELENIWLKLHADEKEYKAKILMIDPILVLFSNNAITTQIATIVSQVYGFNNEPFKTVNAITSMLEWLALEGILLGTIEYGLVK